MTKRVKRLSAKLIGEPGSEQLQWLAVVLDTDGADDEQYSWTASSLGPTYGEDLDDTLLSKWPDLDITAEP